MLCLCTSRAGGGWAPLEKSVDPSWSLDFLKPFAKFSIIYVNDFFIFAYFLFLKVFSQYLGNKIKI